MYYMCLSLWRCAGMIALVFVCMYENVCMHVCMHACFFMYVCMHVFMYVMYENMHPLVCITYVRAFQNLQRKWAPPPRPMPRLGKPNSRGWLAP